MADYQIKGLSELEAYFKGLTPALERHLTGAVYKTAELARADIVDRLTNKIRPHMAYRGKYKGKRVKRLVTNLVDTGALRQSFQVNHIDSLTAEVATNVVYARRLEYGNSKGGKGYFYARDTAKAMEPVFKRLLTEAINKI